MIGLNDQQFVIGAGTNGIGFLWSPNQATQTPLVNILPRGLADQFSTKYTAIAPLMITNTNSITGLTSIVFSATPSVSGSGTQAGTFLMTGSAGGTGRWGLVQMGLPPNTPINAINSSGVIATITSGTAALLLPVQLSQVTFSGTATGEHDVYDDATITFNSSSATYTAQKFSAEHGANQWQAPDPGASGTAQQQGWQDPICYTSGGTMNAVVQFTMPGGGLVSASKIEISGSGVSDPGAVDDSSGYNFPATTATLDSTGKIVTSGTMTCSKAFPYYTVGYVHPLTINWEMSLDGGNTWSPVNKSKNECFAMLANPATDPTGDGNYKLYQTVLYYACGKPGATSEPGAEANSWSMFTANGTGPANICAWNPLDKMYDRPLNYYGAPRGFGGLQPVSTTALLTGTDGFGECYCFGQLFQDALWANGVSNNGIVITPKVNGEGFLVKDLTPSVVSRKWPSPFGALP